MITLIGDNELAKDLIENRQLSEQVDNLVTAGVACGLIAKVEGERLYIVKFVEDDDVELVIMHLMNPDEKENEFARSWFYSIIDPASVVGVTSENIAA